MPILQGIQPVNKPKAGIKMQSISQVYEANVGITTHATATATSTVPKAIKPPFHVGTRSALKTKLYLPSYALGAIATAASLPGTITYAILHSGLIGTKNPYPADKLHTGEYALAVHDVQKLTGVSTHGINYEKVVVDGKNDDVRRWPRNWYGDNIKN